MSYDHDKPLSIRILPDLFAFIFWLVLAFLLKWETKDLVWSLWLSSLVTGYLTILLTLGAGAYLLVAAVPHVDDKKSVMPLIGISVGTGLFLLVFFSIHFGGFHAIHSAFLIDFFPLPGLPKDGFAAGFMNPPLLCILVFRHLMKPYGLFLIPVIIASRNQLFLPLYKAVNLVRAGLDPKHHVDAVMKLKNSPPMGDFMLQPYQNVIRMHCLIFFFAFCHFLKIDNFFVYAVVYCVYFLPWNEIRNRGQALSPS